MVDFKNWDEVQAFVDDKYGKLLEYTVVAYDAEDERHVFPMFAKNQQGAFKNFDAMYLQACSTGQLYPYAPDGSDLDRSIPGLRKVELLDYLSEEVLASYSVG